MKKKDEKQVAVKFEVETSVYKKQVGNNQALELEIKVGNRIFRYEMYPWIKS